MPRSAARPWPRAARTAPHAPRRTRSALDVRTPHSALEAGAEHDARAAAAAPGVRKGANLVAAEMRHWAARGAMPSSARLPRLATRDDIWARDFPHVRQQAQGTALPWVEPVWAYALDRDQLAQSATNPFIEVSPKPFQADND